MAVERFRGNYYFLSNMYPLENWLEIPVGIMVPTSEHGYQLSKFVDEDVQKAVAKAQDGLVAKELAHEFKNTGAHIHSDFQERKVDVMRYWVRQKFTNNLGIADRLVATGDEELIEGNTWNDTFWGVCPPGSDNGQNWLGKTLMEQRKELRSAGL